MPLPRHIAVIMDGNGRWAKSRGLDRTAGHRAGTEAARRIVRSCSDRGIEHLTLYTFSSENWKRPIREVRTLMSLLIEMVRKEVDELNEYNVKLRVLGDFAKLPFLTREALENGMRRTSQNTGMQLHIALSYGGRWEIVEAAKRLAAETKAGRIKESAIDEAAFRAAMPSPDVPDPDLMIRTGGDHRISNFLLWQMAYAELYFTDVLWPDFEDSILADAIDSFGRRERRFGEVPSSS